MPDSGHEALSKALKALQDNPDHPEAAIKGFEDEALELRIRAEALEQIANGIRGLMGKPVPTRMSASISQASAPAFPQPSPAPPTGTPEGMEAVRRIMRGSGQAWTVREVFEEMKKRGWESKDSKEPLRPAEAAVNRLWKVKGEIERVGRGRYRYIETNGDATGAVADTGLFGGAGT
jgi:hypothetical protein